MLDKNLQNNTNKKKLGVFVDDANMFYAQRKAGLRIHYSRLAKLLSGVFDVRFINYYIVIPRESDESYKNSMAHIEALKSRYGNLITIKTKTLKYIWSNEDKKYIKKGNVDGEIMLEAMSHLDDLDAIAIMSGDSDYKILAETLLSKNKEVFFVGFEDTMAWELRQLHHIYLNDFSQYVLVGHDIQKAPAEAGVPLLLESLYSKSKTMSSDDVDKKLV
jgi:uncharacterized LabA/DUF88 family protein